MVYIIGERKKVEGPVEVAEALNKKGEAEQRRKSLELKGILYSEGRILYYLPLTQSELYKEHKREELIKIKKFPEEILAIYTDNKEIYIGTKEGKPNLYQLIKQKKRTIRNGFGTLAAINDITGVGQEIIIGGEYQTLTNLQKKQLIPYQKLGEKGIEDIENIVTNNKETCLHIIKNTYEHSLIELIEENGEYKLGKTIEIKNIKPHSYITRTKPLTKRGYITTASLKEIAVITKEGETILIQGSKIGGNHKWHRLEIIQEKENTLEIIASGDFTGIEYMKINTQQDKVTQRQTIITPEEDRTGGIMFIIGENFREIEILTSPSVHEWIMKKYG